MPNHLLSMQLVRLILQLLQKGFSHRRIAREVHLSRSTVKQYTHRLLGATYRLEELQAMNDEALAAIVHAQSKQKQRDSRKVDFEGRLSYFTEELRRTGVTKLLLWREYRKQYPTGYGYTQFCELFKQHRQLQHATMHFHYRPAEGMMVDFAGEMLYYVNKESAERVPCPVFVAVLPYSGYSFAVALANAQQPNVIHALNECLSYFEGVPQSVTCDNMKQAVRKSCRYEPLFTDTLQQWALHNNITLMATRPGKPKDKAAVENEVKLTYQRIYAPLRHRMFCSLQEVNGAIEEQLREHHRLPFQRKTYSRLDQFSTEEKPLLQPLPARPFVFRHSVQAKVQKNYHITLGEDWHHYSVPFSYIGKTVSVIYDTDIVEVYYECKRIALHARSYRAHGYTTLAEHMPESHQHYLEQRGWNGAYFLEQAAKIGPCTHHYVEGMLRAKQFTEQTYKGCLGLLRLAKAYGETRLEAACKRAGKGQTFTYRTVRNILTHNLDSLESGEPVCLFSVPLHDNLRGAEAYH